MERVSIGHVELDYEFFINKFCTGVNWPTDPAELEEMLIELERIIGNRAEADRMEILLNENDSDCANAPVSVTRIATSCFQFCLIPINTDMPYGPTKTLCPSDICCFQTKTYCRNGDTTVVSGGSQWKNGKSCGSSSCNEVLAKCAHDCSVIF